MKRMVIALLGGKTLIFREREYSASFTSLAFSVWP